MPTITRTHKAGTTCTAKVSCARLPQHRRLAKRTPAQPEDRLSEAGDRIVVVVTAAASRRDADPSAGIGGRSGSGPPLRARGASSRLRSAPVDDKAAGIVAGATLSFLAGLVLFIVFHRAAAVCSSTLGQLGQALSQSAGRSCSIDTLASDLSYVAFGLAVVLVGAAVAVHSLRGRRPEVPLPPPGWYQRSRFGPLEYWDGYRWLPRSAWPTDNSPPGPPGPRG